MSEPGPEPRPGADFTTPTAPKSKDEYTDGRQLWDWKSRYEPEAREQINWEAGTLGLVLVTTLAAAAICLGIVDNENHKFVIGQVEVHVSFRLLAIFLTGCVGGATFSIKWLIHSVAKGIWHLDRRYWRLLVPIIGGVYACVVMTLSGNGLFSGTNADLSMTPATAALAFLVGYFSDGVSGLLSNIANAMFGTLEKK